MLKGPNVKQVQGPAEELLYESKWNNLQLAGFPGGKIQLILARRSNKKMRERITNVSLFASRIILCGLPVNAVEKQAASTKTSRCSRRLIP
jgi:hypothetical protein